LKLIDGSISRLQPANDQLTLLLIEFANKQRQSAYINRYTRQTIEIGFNIFLNIYFSIIKREGFIFAVFF